jgi:hypothetical protein
MMANAPATRSPAKGPAAKSRRRLIRRAASAPLRVAAPIRNDPPSGGENVWTMGASTFGIGRHPLESERRFCPPIPAAMIASFILVTLRRTIALSSAKTE